MEPNETRLKLIDIIADHQASYPSQKLPTGELSQRAGISRQAFSRYYSDLKDYASGKKPIGDLLANVSSVRTIELLNQHQATLRTAQQKLARVEEQYNDEMKKEMELYVTSLMMNDISMHGANEIRVTLEKQTLYNMELKKQLSHMEIELARAKQASMFSPNSRGDGTGLNTEKVKVEVDLAKAFATYVSTKSLDEFEDLKDIAVASALRSINKLAAEKRCNIVIFSERYISRFKLFFEKYHSTEPGLTIVVRLPIFDRSEMRAFLSKLAPSHSISLYIPYCESQSEINAQRGFYFGEVSKPEIEAADNSDTFLINQGFHKIVHFKVKQGE